MAVQNRTTYQATVDTLAADNATGDISESDVRTLYKNLSDSAPFFSETSSLGADPTSWDLASYDINRALCTQTGNLSIELQNITGRVLGFLSITDVTGNFTLTFTESSATLLFRSGSRNTSVLDIVAASGDEVLVAFQRINNVIYFWQLGNNLLDEDNLVSDSEYFAPTQQSVKAYVDNNGGGVSTTAGTNVTQSSDGTATVDFSTGELITLTLNANVTTLTISNLDDTSKRVPVILRIEQNASTGYSITSVADLDNGGDAINPPLYSTTAGEDTLWYITKTDFGLSIRSIPNVATS